MSASGQPMNQEGHFQALTAHESMPQQANAWRFACVVVLLSGIFLLMAWRVVDLQVIDHEFLTNQGNARSIGVEQISAHRGMLLDRHGEPLAVSTPVSSIWVNPKQIEDARVTAKALAKWVGVSAGQIEKRITDNPRKGFVYIKRHLPPELAEQIMQLDIPGVYREKEYKRYYPAGEVTSHLVGFTDIDDAGQEGLELAYNEWLHGSAGKRRVLKDRYGRIIKDIGQVSGEKAGQNLSLTIDLRLQYLAYRELMAAVQAHRAKSGSLVMLDAKTGEVLAMVNQPAYNPNKRSTLNHANLRNRAVTDVFEPGSTVKPMTVAAAIESGLYSANSVLDTSPGYLRLGKNTIRDHRNYGRMTLSSMITKSSNVGVSKLALNMEGDYLRSLFFNAGLGRETGSGFPGERSGLLPFQSNWRDIEQATLSYGYGLSVTALQLAQAYTLFANQGVMQAASLVQGVQPSSQHVISADTAEDVLGMLESVISEEGTGKRAAVQGYRVAGKTGTVHKLSAGGYQKDKYTALFAGVAPVTNPKLVAVVLIDEPKGELYYGGEVAAPVFSRVVGGAMRVLNIPPDAVDRQQQQLTTTTEDEEKAKGGAA